MTGADRPGAIAEMARVLTAGGRFVGCYNAPGHLHELWSRFGVAEEPDDFDARNGAAQLCRAFSVVETRGADGEVLWESRERLQAYLDAYREIYGPLAAPAGPYPFRASRRNVVFVATR